MQIRDAESRDLPEIQAIYAHHVLNGTGSFEEIPPSVEAITARHTYICSRGWSWLVAEDASGVTGFGYFGQYRERSAYRFAAEDSIYIRPDVRGQGVGKMLVTQLLTEAENTGFRQMVAVIGGSENVASIGLHSSLGFQMAGKLRNVAFKFGQWLDSVLMQRTLGAGANTLPPAP